MPEIERMAAAGLILITAMSVLAAGTVTGGYVLEKQPGFCALCHEMQPAYDNWRASGAAEDHPDCVQCHRGSGLVGVLDAQRRGARDVVAHLTGNYEQPIASHVPDAWCTRCHTNGEMVGEHREEAPEFEAKACAACHDHAPGVAFSGEEEEEEREEREEEEEEREEEEEEREEREGDD